MTKAASYLCLVLALVSPSLCYPGQNGVRRPTGPGNSKPGPSMQGQIMQGEEIATCKYYYIVFCCWFSHKTCRIIGNNSIIKTIRRKKCNSSKVYTNYTPSARMRSEGYCSCRVSAVCQSGSRHLTSRAMNRSTNNTTYSASGIVSKNM